MKVHGTATAVSDERLSVAVAAPVGDDASILSRLVETQGARPVRLTGLGIASIDALLLTQEALHDRFVEALCRFYSAEPTWSAPPLVVLVDASSIVADPIERLRLERPNLNVFLLHRPRPTDEITAALKTAMAARRDQFRLQHELAAHQAAEQRVEFLLSELQHRVKNLFGIVGALATQTFQSHHGSVQEFRDVFGGRLQGLANAYDVLAAGGFASVSLDDLARRVVKPLAPSSDGGSVVFEGPRVTLPPRTADALGLALHELAANAAKYGAFSTEPGIVTVRWTREAGMAVIDWVERGGPPVVAPTQRGFGSTVIESMFAHQSGGEVDLRFPPEGVECRLTLPLPDHFE